MGVLSTQNEVANQITSEVGRAKRLVSVTTLACGVVSTSRSKTVHRVQGTLIAVNPEKTNSTRIGEYKIHLGEFVVGIDDRVHDNVRGTAIDGELLTEQHGGSQTERSSN